MDFSVLQTNGNVVKWKEFMMTFKTTRLIVG